MFQSVKKWLGIEGVKLDLEVQESIPYKATILSGNITFRSLRRECVESVYINMKEVYRHGRSKNSRTDDYLMGETDLDGPFEIPVEEELSIPFELAIRWYESDMDKLERKSRFVRPFVRFMKWTKGVQSTYLLTAEARVRDTKLHPFDQQILKVKG